MRKRILFLCFVALLSTSCGQKPEELSAEEVLRRAIIRGSSIESAKVSASVAVTLNGYNILSGSSVIQGLFHSHGAWSADISFLLSDARHESFRESGTLNVLTLDGSQFFLHPTILQGNFLSPFASTLSGSMNGWWTIGEPRPLAASKRPILTPEALHETTSMFVIKNMQLQITDKKRAAYVLDTELSPEAIHSLFVGSGTDQTTAVGRLWIDSKDFSLLKAAWTLHAIKTQYGFTDIAFDTVFTDYNRAPSVILPTGTSAQLSIDNGVLNTIFK